DGACGILRCSILCLGTTAGSQNIGRCEGSKDGEQGRGSVADANCPVRVGVRHEEIADAGETSRWDRVELYAEQVRYEVEDGSERPFEELFATCVDAINNGIGKILY